MLSYKEYKLLNESLYGAFNLGLRSHGTVGGIVSASGINGTEAAIEAQAEEAIEEAKKMKKKMDGEEDMEDEDEVEDDVHSDEDEEGDEDSEDEEEGDDDSDDDSEDEEDGDEEKELAFMKKKSKKEWSEVMSDLEEVLEAIEDEEALTEVKKGLEMMKKGMEKGCGCGKSMGKKCGKYMSEGKKAHKTDCDCPICEKKKDHDEEDKDGGEGLTAGQKKLPKALQDAILAKKGKKKGGDEKKCGKKMNEDEAAWWKSVNEMLGADPDQKNWDGGWSEVGEVQQAVRENAEINEVLGIGTPDYPGKPGAVSRIVQSPLDAFKRFAGKSSHTQDAYMKSAHEKAVEVALARVLGKKQEADELEKELRSTYTDHPDAENKFGSNHTLSNDIWAKMEHIKEYMKQGMSPHDAAEKVAKSVAMHTR